ncbi:MAG: ABC transporter permease [Bacteroidales bacterium]|nr:ABC transporter permease [Bacteroidales bacterium]MBS3776690.1 ABC transporter permease [Bacteroidales bacterium]
MIKPFIHLFIHIGRYLILMGRVFAPPEKKKMYYRQTIKEIEFLGLNSMGIVAIISIFIGAVITIQTSYNTESPLYPSYLIGLAVRDILLLEFSSTIVALILAGKIGSNIASELGSMRITEQIDALEIMGVNSASYLIMPKILAAVFFLPFLTIMSIFIGLIGGWLGGIATGVVSPQDYLYGIQYAFIPYYVTYTLIKAAIFGFIITSIAAYRGYYAYGGALQVGKSSTRAVVESSIFILITNYVLTQLLLT